jgi:hypothetical protein
MLFNISNMLKRKLSSADLFLIAVNLIPVWGVWFNGWNAREVFMVYCLETIVIGLYTLLKLAIAGLVIKKDVWQETNGNNSSMPAWFFMIFFTVHYGFFVAIQLSIFLSISGAERETGIANAWDFLVHFNRYLSPNSLWLLGGLVASYGFITLKDFVLNGAFRTASLGIIMFEPYGRIFVQQFTVIVGSLFLGMGAGKVFISLFACIKIFIDVVVNYRSIIEIMAQRQKKSVSSKQ